MFKKSLLMCIGGLIIMVGIILFPLPVPLGLPTMIVGLAIMFKASNRVKRIIIRVSNKNQHTQKLWQKVRAYRLRKKIQAYKK